MLLTFKDLQQKKFTVEVEPSDTVSLPSFFIPIRSVSNAVD